MKLVFFRDARESGAIEVSSHDFLSRFRIEKLQMGLCRRLVVPLAHPINDRHGGFLDAQAWTDNLKFVGAKLLPGSTRPSFSPGDQDVSNAALRECSCCPAGSGVQDGYVPEEGLHKAWVSRNPRHGFERRSPRQPDNSNGASGFRIGCDDKRRWCGPDPSSRESPWDFPFGQETIVEGVWALLSGRHFCQSFTIDRDFSAIMSMS